MVCILRHWRRRLGTEELYKPSLCRRVSVRHSFCLLSRTNARRFGRVFAIAIAWSLWSRTLCPWWLSFVAPPPRTWYLKGFCTISVSWLITSNRFFFQYSSMECNRTAHLLTTHVSRCSITLFWNLVFPEWMFNELALEANVFVRL